MGGVWTFVRSVPDVVWSGLLASLLTLGGVLISNASNTRRLMLQLGHDANEKAKERTAVLRRTVYLEAAHELVRAHHFLAALPQADFETGNLMDALLPLYSATTKLQVIAEPRTAALVNTLVTDYSKLAVRAVTDVMPVQLAKADIKIQDDLYQASQAQVTRILAEQTALVESAERDEVRFANLQRSFEGHRQQLQAFAAARAEAWQRFQALQVDFSTHLLGRLRAISRDQIPVLIEIRRDLGITADLDELRAQMERQLDELESGYAEAVDRIAASPTTA